VHTQKPKSSTAHTNVLMVTNMPTNILNEEAAGELYDLMRNKQILNLL